MSRPLGDHRSCSRLVSSQELLEHLCSRWPQNSSVVVCSLGKCTGLDSTFKALFVLGKCVWLFLYKKQLIPSFLILRVGHHLNEFLLIWSSGCRYMMKPYWTVQVVLQAPWKNLYPVHRNAVRVQGMLVCSCKACLRETEAGVSEPSLGYIVIFCRGRKEGRK